VFQVAVVNGRVQYLQNASIIYESSRRPSFPLAFAAALGTVGTPLTDARIDTSGRDFVGTTGRYDSGTTGRYDSGSAGRYDSSSYDSTSFAALDRNRDGVLTIGEFNVTAREFVWIDLT